MKLINKSALHILIDRGYVDPSKMEGIAITSKNKKSNGKKYYAKDILAFTAWSILGEDMEDKDFQKWKADQEKRKKRNKRD